jgi:hypothetical protein
MIYVSLLKNEFNYIVFFLFFSITFCFGQISPGDLSQSHSNLEGMSNCTQCHELGYKVTDKKCLECHKEIQSLINQNKGYHANKNVKKQDCFECHSEHHGRKFDMVRFDENTFNHNDTGYRLEGKHNSIDCRKCHQPDNISNSEIKKRKQTFLGLNDECISCHDDYHQKTLGTDCKKCHTMDAFSPASKFNHDQTEFPLIGAHQNINCIQCHKKETKNGEEFQEFKGIAFQDCKSCHNDPHNNQLPGKCNDCHSEVSFQNFNGQTFNHNVTNFKLKGKHNTIDCFACHKKTDNEKLVFQDLIGKSESNCLACHNDTHEGKFGLECVKCHNEESFFALNNMDFFDHNKTDYSLEGKHLEVDCKQCHTGRYTKTIDFSACNKCHNDYHNGEFTENNFTPDCVECHSLQEGFEYSLYTLEQHQETEFPLEGAHLATPCFACHISEDNDQWTFKNLGETCVDCHVNIHEDYINPSYYPENNCKACHVSDSWAKIDSFDHSKTGWNLTGKHKTTACRSCHFIENSDNKSVIDQKFIKLDTDCASCHENVHDTMFEIDGITDCNRCHITEHWIPEKFNHNTTRFPLEGKHTQVECNACHTSSIIDGKVKVLYKLNKLKCIDCHI